MHVSSLFHAILYNYTDPMVKKTESEPSVILFRISTSLIVKFRKIGMFLLSQHGVNQVFFTVREYLNFKHEIRQSFPRVYGYKFVQECFYRRGQLNPQPEASELIKLSNSLIRYSLVSATPSPMKRIIAGTLKFTQFLQLVEILHMKGERVGRNYLACDRVRSSYEFVHFIYQGVIVLAVEQTPVRASVFK